MNTTQFKQGLDKEQRLALNALIFDAEKRSRDEFVKKLQHHISEEMPKEIPTQENYTAGFRNALNYVFYLVEGLNKQ